MKNKVCVILLAVFAAAATFQGLSYGQEKASKSSQQSAAKPAAKAAATQKPPAPPAKAASTADTAALVAQGKARFQAYGCKDCHGENGEGADDGPDLIHTRKNADQIEAMLKKPSKDADIKGMPAIPATSPDLKPLVAYVLSLKAPEAK
jgi:mono/diheme cytochrome c family protein